MRFVIIGRGVLYLETGEYLPLHDHQIGTIVSALKTIKKVHKTTISFYLPPSFFIATIYKDDALAQISQSQLQHALHYQQDEILPGCTHKMSVVASACIEHPVALWMHSEWIDELQLSLNKAGIKLDYITLRSLLPAINKKQPILIEDIENEQNTLIEVSDNGIVSYAAYQHADLEEEDIRHEYEAKLAEYKKSHQYLRFENIEDWKALSTDVDVDKVWRFYPSMALQNKIKKRARRIRFLAGMGMLSVLLLVSLPFIKLAYEKYEIKKVVKSLEEQGQSVIKARADIAGHTHYWEALDTFPNPKVLSLLYELDKHVPKHSWLTVFRLREAVIEIEGYSSDPAAVLEVLSALPDFENVAFSQASRQEKGYPDKTFFGIRLQLRQRADDYMERFFAS